MASSDKSSHLKNVIQCIMENKKDKQIIQNEDLPKLYGQADRIISQFDTSITRCKKYNEAKINRKYQIIIRDLEEELQKITQKLKVEQEARSPTKKHISDILDKLVLYKDNNDSLKKQLIETKRKVQQLQEQNQQQAIAIHKLQNQNKTSIQRLPSVNPTLNVYQAAKSFLKQKERMRSNNELINMSNFQNFMTSNRVKMVNWNLGNLFQQVDKWGQGIKDDNKKIDMWKIRSGIARKFSEYIDDSQSLVAPSLANNKSRLYHYQTKLKDTLSPPPHTLQSLAAKPNRKKLSGILSIKIQKRSLQSSLI